MFEGDTEVLSAQDATLPSGSVGFYTWNDQWARFDSAVVRLLDPVN